MTSATQVIVGKGDLLELEDPIDDRVDGVLRKECANRSPYLAE